MDRILKIILPVIIIAASLLVWQYFMSNRPEAKKSEPKRILPIVKTEKAVKTLVPLTAEGFGTVQTAKEITIKSEAGGRVIWKNPEFDEGHYVKAEEVLFKFDPLPYEYALKSAEAAYAAAVRSLAEVEHEAEIAAKEWEFWNRDKAQAEKPGALADYELQKNEAEANLAEAGEKVKSAQSDLDRTVYVAPFDSIVFESAIETGSVTKSGDSLGRLAYSGYFEVSVPFPANVTVNFSFSEKEADASPVCLVLTDGSDKWTYRGYLSKQLPEAEGATGMIKTLIRLPLTENNLADKPFPAAGMNLKAVLSTREALERVVISEAALREGGVVWAVENNKVRIMPIRVNAYRDDKVIIYSGLEGGEDLIVSRLKGVVEGMDVSMGGDQKPAGSSVGGQN
jgi:gold/copper resistance efflux system membrane fusion protein